MQLNNCQKGITVSLGAHLLVFVLLGLAGWQSWESRQQDNRIYTVQIVSGGVPGAKSGGGTAAALPAQPSQAVSRTQVRPSSEIPLPGATPVPAANASAPLEAPEPAGAAVGSSAATGTGTGAGIGSGTETGSGDGSGTGEGTGGGGPSFDVDAIQPDVSPELLSSVPAAYPEQLRSYGIQGSVRVQLVVGKDGSVETASVIASSGYGLMDQAALDAAYGYTFSPAYKEGIPVRCYATRTFRFYLH